MNYQERARERFEEFKRANYINKFYEFEIEQMFLLEEEFKEVPEKETRRKRDLLDLLKCTKYQLPKDAYKKKNFGGLDDLVNFVNTSYSDIAVGMSYSSNVEYKDIIFKDTTVYVGNSRYDNIIKALKNKDFLKKLDIEEFQYLNIKNGNFDNGMYLEFGKTAHSIIRREKSIR